MFGTASIDEAGAETRFALLGPKTGIWHGHIPGYGAGTRYGFRALLGCDEEVGMTDVHHYLESHEQPLFLFTPDAEFPICNAEKGCFGGMFVSAPIKDGAIESWSGADATNAIPSESVCVLAVPRL